MSGNPFDEWPEKDCASTGSDYGDERLYSVYSVRDMDRWRGKWEPRALEAFEKAQKWNNRNIHWKELEEQNFNQYQTIQNKYKEIDELKQKLEAAKNVNKKLESFIETCDPRFEDRGLLRLILKDYQKALEAKG